MMHIRHWAETKTLGRLPEVSGIGIEGLIDDVLK